MMTPLISNGGLMAEADSEVRDSGGYVVFRQVDEDLWYVVGEVERRPGLTARASRAQAVDDASGGNVIAGAVYAAVPRSEWRVARQL
jgi:hypothetical protein